MNILYITYFFRPDLSAGSFRNTDLIVELSNLLDEGDTIELITTKPNRYKSYSVDAPEYETDGKIKITRVNVPNHSGLKGQVITFVHYYRAVWKIVRKRKYDAVFVSSSKLFSGLLGARISKVKRIPFYLDLRDALIDGLLGKMKNPLIRYTLGTALKVIEKYTLNSAGHLNLVSEGFRENFSYYKGEVSWFTNGIGEQFINYNFSDKDSAGNKVITYAGNFGIAQGLECIIPDAAKKLPEYTFKLYGDGNRKEALLENIKENSLNNVLVFEPIKQDELLEVYNKSEYLLVHLNNTKSLEAPIPSKIFEYGATGKKVIAGLRGFTANFLKQNIPDAILFKPCNADEMVEKIISYNTGLVDRTDFRKKFRRKTIMANMAKSMHSFVKTHQS